MRRAKPSKFEGLGLIVAFTIFAGGCEFFGGEEEAGGDESGDTGQSETTGDEPPPSRGFRVFPKFMLQDVPAIVTIDIDGISPTSCPLDDVEGGYLCDADDLPNGSLATIMVERDGFDMAVRHPEVPFNQIEPLEVHLAVEGGPTGTWSPCAVAGDFETCDDLCATFVSTCVVTSCATDQEEWPLATFETFADAECTEPLESIALACTESLPLAESSVAALRCCCAS